MTLLIENLRVELRGRVALDGLGLEARRGELIAVIGPNGAGKTTLLKAVCRLIPFSGRLEWDGRPLAALSPAERARTLAYLPQGHAIHWPITAREAVTIGRAPFSSNLTRLTRADEEAVGKAIDAVDAWPFIDRPVTELSGGERARVMLARALAVDAPLILADEPVAALDPAHQLSVMRILSRQAQSGRLVIAVSHDLVLAARFASRVAVLNGGRLAGIGKPRDILTAGLIGDVFGVETKRIMAGDEVLELPWEPAAR
jgi:iron complex transport system ATP-binding protein